LLVRQIKNGLLGTQRSLAISFSSLGEDWIRVVLKRRESDEDLKELLNVQIYKNKKRNLKVTNNPTRPLFVLRSSRNTQMD